MRVILDVVKAVKITDVNLGLHTAHNAMRKTSEKLLLYLYFPLFKVKTLYNFDNSLRLWLHIGQAISLIAKMLNLDEVILMEL